MRIRLHAATLALIAGITSNTALAQDDVTAGRKLALNHCGACHSLREGEAARQGPPLFGVFGRAAGSVSGFAYSTPFAAALNGKAWDAAQLDRWLADPQAVAPGTVMLYRQDDPEKRALLIRFLETLRP